MSIAPGRRLRVGVTLFLRGGPQSIWENGIFQNCYFLLTLLQKSPLVERCFLVNGGPGRPEEAGAFVSQSPAPIIDMATALGELDVIIELSAQLDANWAHAFRGRGGKIVAMRVANDFIIDAERMAYRLPHGLLMSRTPYDVVWTLPAFVDTCASYYRLSLGAPVKPMQHLWNARFIEQGAAEQGRSFAYRPGRARWRLAIMEPNICTVKTCHLPLVLCDLAYRAAPQHFEVLRVFNALKLKEHAGFVGFATSLDLVRHGAATFEGRHAVFDVLGKEADALVSHHWHNAQNYLYYEALHGGYPLIHNSDLLDGCGYRYRTFDCEDGALALGQAFLEHDTALDGYRRQANRFLARLDPESETNIAAYTAEIAALFEPSH